MMAASGDGVATPRITWQSRGFPCPVDFASVPLWKKATQSWAYPFLLKGKAGSLAVEDAVPLLSACDEIDAAVERYNANYDVAAEQADSRLFRTTGKAARNGFMRALAVCHYKDMLLHSLWALGEVIVRVLSPLLLRLFIKWLKQDTEGTARTREWEGWLLALALGSTGFFMALAHHQLFWIGMRMGFVMRQQAVAAVQEKLLRLNGSTLGDLSSGQVINLVSNDVRRFDDFGPFWVFIWAAPVELGLVLLMVALEVGFWPALAGISTLLLVIPVQSKFAGTISRLRLLAAARTDERVRLTGEVIEGILSVKMLSWEKPFQSLLSVIRNAEATYLWKMMMINGSSMALMFFCTPVASFVTFAVAVSTGHTLSLPSVFYVISLLHLPKLWTACFFVKAVKSISETVVSTRRINNFLLQPEALAPTDIQADLPVGTVQMNGANFAWWSRAWAGLPDSHASLLRSPGQDMSSLSAMALPKQATRSFGLTRYKDSFHSMTRRAPSSKTASPASTPTGDGDEVPRLLTLRAPRFQVKPGELVGICGEVGGGKSSLLAALLGELQPIPPPDWVMGTPIPGAPVLVGTIAYCQQIPWIEAGSVRENVTFGAPFDEERYRRVVSACALDQDIASLPSGDETEIGERGINLSGGQKARLALARAAFSQADVMLLDDPLSAVDPRVARTLFQDCIGPTGVMRHATRLLVTHQVQWLSHCDRVMVVRMGEIVANGTWAELQADPGLPELHKVSDEAHLDDDIYNTEPVTSQPASIRAASNADTSEAADPILDVCTVSTDAAANSPSTQEAAGKPPRHAVHTNEVQAMLVASAGDALVSHHESSLAGRSSDEAMLEDAPLASAKLMLPLVPEEAVGSVDGDGAAPAASESSNVSASSAPGPVVESCRDEAHTSTTSSSPLEACPWIFTGEGGSSSSTPRATHAPMAASQALVCPDEEHRSDAAFETRELCWRHAPECEGDLQPCCNSLRSRASRRASRRADVGLEVVVVSMPRSPALDSEPRCQQWDILQRLRPRLSREADLACAGPLCEALEAADAGGDTNGKIDDKPAAAESKPSTGPVPDGKALQDNEPSRLVVKEHQEVGGISGSVYRHYIAHIGWTVTAVLLVALVVGQASWIVSEYWLSRWAESDDQKDSKWIYVYACLVGGVVFLAIGRSILYLSAGLHAGTLINREMVSVMLRAPLSFFHTNPGGRILNRFSKDQGSVDEQLPETSFDSLQTIGMVAGAVVVVAIANPLVIAMFVPLAYMFMRYRTFYLITSREVKRFESVTRSPVFAMFSAVMKGLPTIRAYRSQPRFRAAFLDALNLSGAWWMGYLGCARWVGFKMDLVSAILLMSACILMMALKSWVDPGLVALSITQLLQLAGSMQWAVRQTAETENYLTSAERMLEYTKLPQERSTVEEGAPAPPDGWPTSAALEFCGVSARYREGLPLVLRNLSFRVPSGTSCGIVGRTGSGKSSLVLALMHLVPIDAGQILLDGVDVASFGLDALRRQVAIIAQDPLLFSGTLRSNLDPWNAYTDERLWEVLQAVQLAGRVKAIGGLLSRMAETGSNFSAGQRQLLCLARALLINARVLALDEATANVDRQTDSLIQTVLHNAVKGVGTGGQECIMLVIAHRIDTIMDCDQLLVLGDGQLLESGAPRQLAEAQDGVFARLVTAAAANERERDREV